MDSPATAQLHAAVAAVRARTDQEPEVALVLGSGLGDLAEAAEAAVAVPTTAVPGYPRATVAGHRGRLVFGRLEGRPVVFVQGRVHLYEGHPLDRVTFPIRLVHALGARRLLVTNAAGGINPAFRPGTLMFITDHLDRVAPRPPSGRAARFGAWGRGLAAGARVADLYDPAWLDAAEHVALERGIATRRGVYLWTRGPSYETKAEIRAFRRMGADAVGMSTVPEVVEAHLLGLRVLGISTITNPAAGLSLAPLAHDDVLQVGRQMRGALETLVREILAHTL